MSAIQNVVVAGATGNLGPIVVQSLLSSGFKVSILTRDTTKRSLSGAVAIQTDYSLPSLVSALKGQDAIISTIGAPATLTQLVLIDAAVAAGVKRFIPSDFAPNTPRLHEMEKALPELYMRLKPKVTVLEYLETQAAAHPQFSWTAVGNGPLFDWTMKIGLLGTSLKTRTAIITDSGDEPYLTVTTAQIARALNSVLLHPTDTRNQYLKITSWITTQNKVLEALETATKSKWEVKHVSAAQRHKEGLELLAKGNFFGIGNLWNVWCNSDGRGHLVEEGEMANEMLGLPKEDLSDVVADIVQSVG